MNRASVLARLACAAVLGGSLVATAGCSTVDSVHGWFLKGNVLTYDQYLSVDQSASPPPTADDVLKRLGMPMAVKDRDGVRREIDYHAHSLNGDMKTAEFHFDEQEKLIRKELW